MSVSSEEDQQMSGEGKAWYFGDSEWSICSVIEKDIYKSLSTELEREAHTEHPPPNKKQSSKAFFFALSHKAQIFPVPVRPHPIPPTSSHLAPCQVALSDTSTT